MFCTFLLRNVLRATTACTFSTSQRSKAVWTWCAFYILIILTLWLSNVLRATTVCNFSSRIQPDGSAPAALASFLFDLPEPQPIGNLEKHSVSRLFPFPAPASSFFWFFLLMLSSDSFSSLFFSSPLLSSLLFSSLLWRFPPLLFHLSILSEVWLLR